MGLLCVNNIEIFVFLVIFLKYVNFIILYIIKYYRMFNDFVNEF